MTLSKFWERLDKRLYRAIRQAQMDETQAAVVTAENPDETSVAVTCMKCEAIHIVPTPTERTAISCPECECPIIIRRA